jgi:SynChlorMet cassette radical SAM/SPASM protein ScmF
METVPTFGQKYPLSSIYFYLTEGCNLACRHCWLAPRYDPKLKNTTFLPVDLFERIINEAIPLGLKTVKLTGGEPLLHPQIDRLIEIVRKSELSLMIESNGILCTPNLVQQLAKFPNCEISISLDGADAATHEAIRGVSGSFDKACKAVTSLSKAGLDPQVIFSVMRSNVDQIEAIIHLAEELGAKSLKFNVILPISRGKNVNSQVDALTVSEYIAVGHRIDNELSQRTDMELSFDYPQAFQTIRRLVAQSNYYCGIQHVLGVLPSGKYALCGIGEVIPDLVFGQSGVDNLISVWEQTPLLNELRQGLPSKLEGICRDCLMVDNCQGACIAQNIYTTHNLWAPYWFCEDAEDADLFPLSRKRQ